MTTSAATIQTPLAQPGLPALRERVSTRDTIRHILLMAWRALIKMRRNPEQFFDVTLQPLLFTPMFGYIFGGAIAGGVSKYLPLLIPGILAQTALTTCMGTGVQLREDLEKGVFDRFKSLPMSRVAALAGPALADTVRYVVATTVTLAVGLAMGYRPGGGFWGVVAAGLLVVVAAWSLAWIFTFLGTILRSAQGVQGISLMIMFPLTFLSNAFVPVDSLPGWLRAFVNVNPVSYVVSGVRSMANDGVVTSQVGWALLGCAAVVAVFLPLAVRSYKRML
ncbi:MAG TPA: ABC transporter permease [Dermatophilaceae bacterium]|nr:ABC transporter permease [Dermatophilaceae bacterium]